MSFPLISKDIIKYTLEIGKIKEKDFLAVEKQIFIYVNNKTYNLSGTPTYLEELILGFLRSQNFIDPSVTLKSLECEETKNKISIKLELLRSNQDLNFISRGEEDFKIESKKLLELFREFLEASELFKITGCTHSAALANIEQILFLVEDVRRHNAMYKVLGWAYLNKIFLGDKMFFISSRVSSEIVKEAIQEKIPLVASRGAPTSLAVELAEENGLTLIGFLRENRFNLYTHSQRIIF